MDLYITDSLQDMLDMDIKNEMATDLSSITDFPVRNKSPNIIQCVTDNDSANVHVFRLCRTH